jgi:eukaryotic-like serine/threonine-protein kinase
MDVQFRIGPWLVQPSLNVISQNGTTVRLEPKVMEVLVCLAQRAGEPVPREELIQAVWPATFVTDDVLKRCISELRRVFEDDAREPRIIETIPKRGYRLLASIAEVRPANSNHSIPSAAVVNAVAPEQAVRRTARPPKLLFLAGAACLLLLACITLAYVLVKRSTVLAAPTFHRLTFERGLIYSARFAPDNQIVYDASWDNKPIRIFITHAGILQPMPLDLASAHLLGVSASGELALTLNGYPEFFPVFVRGTLARTPMAGGAPRELLEDVRWADWGGDGELAVVHHSNARSRLEYPAGRVLYENAGWISHIRVSPRNNYIAFVDHPIWAEDRGSIMVVDLKNQGKKILSTGWESAQGLAWSASGDEIWFTAAKSGERRDLFAVDLRGRQRTLLRIPGGLTLHDVSPDGRVLLTVDNERSGSMALSPSGERDLSWFDIDFPLAISPDGKKLLLSEQSQQAGSDYWIGLRGTDGSPPVHLGDGWGGDFSPDGKWVGTNIPSIPESTFLLRVGAGERKELKHPGVHALDGVWFMPDGQSVLFMGLESGHSPRSYIQSLQGGPPQPVTPEGILGIFPSPNGRYLAAEQADQRHFIYDIQRGESRAIPGTNRLLWPVRWSSDSRYLYLYTRTGPPSQIWRLEISSGREKLVTQLAPTDPAGILEIFNVVMAPDGTTFAYGYDRYLSELYVVDGLH